MNYIRQVLQDIDGSYSSKRAAFFVFVLLFVALTVGVLFKAVPRDAVAFVQTTEDKLVDLIKWIGGFIVGEQASKFAPKKEDSK